MTGHVTVFDAEWLSAPGAMQRMWCGLGDPDPTVVQIGAVRLALTGSFEIADTIDILIQPRDRTGEVIALDPWFANFTGLTDARLATDGMTLARGLQAFADFAGDDPVYSWGKDEMMVMGISPYLAGLPPPLPVSRFGHGGDLLQKAGFARDAINTVRSNTITAFLGLPQQEVAAHDGLEDAKEVARAIQHLLRTGKLSAADVTTL